MIVVVEKCPECHVKQYRLKTPVIEALQWTGTNMSEVEKFVGSAASWTNAYTDTIPTLIVDGVFGAINVTDYIIKLPSEEFDTRSAEEFELAYEPCVRTRNAGEPKPVPVEDLMKLFLRGEPSRCCTGKCAHENTVAVYDFCELFGQHVLYTEERVPRSMLPVGLYVYDVRGCDDDPGCPANIERHVVVNFCGTIISKAPLMGAAQEFVNIFERLNYLGEEMTLQEYTERK